MVAFHRGELLCVGEADLVRVEEAVRLSEEVAVREEEAPSESVLVVLGDRVRVAVAVGLGVGMVQLATMARSLYVPTHGSSNTPFQADTTQLELPTQNL